MNDALGRRRNRVETEQRASRHNDLAAVLAREINQVGPRQQGARAEHHYLLAGHQHRRANALQSLAWRAFDREIGVAGKFGKFYKRTGNLRRVEPRFRLADIARRRAGQRKPRQAVCKPPRNGTPNSAETRDRDSGFVHHAPPSMLVYTLAQAAMASEWPRADHAAAGR